MCIFTRGTQNQSPFHYLYISHSLSLWTQCIYKREFFGVFFIRIVYPSGEPIFIIVYNFVLLIAPSSLLPQRSSHARPSHQPSVCIHYLSRLYTCALHIYAAVNNRKRQKRKQILYSLRA